MKKTAYIFVITLIFSFFISCKKDKAITSPSAKLSFSQDSILFDTVFTSIGSTTKLFRIHNRNNGKLIISSLKLARGNSSFYRLNVDGTAGKSFTNLEIAAQDSMYVFVEVTIDPNYDPITSPFIYKDSILFEVNGSQQHFDLIAFGQNAYYYTRDKKIYDSNGQLALYYDTLPNTPNSSGTYTMQNDKPHVIYGPLLVDSSQTLIIQAGAKIYMHDGAYIWVYSYGNINVNGSPSSPVTFQGDRLEQEYKDVPGQWDRIWINEGGNNTINYAVIKNAYIGIHAGYAALGGFGTYVSSSPPAPQLTLKNTIIQNCSYDGILAQNYSITGGNDVVVNCGSHLLEFNYGGNYTFYQSTFANYWQQTNNSSSSSSRTTPSFVFNNFFNGSQLSAFDTVKFGNCIFDGTLAEEFHFDTLSPSSVPGFTVPYMFDHCALKTIIPGFVGGSHTTSCITITNQQDMSYANTATYDFHIGTSPDAYQNGNPIYAIQWPSTIDDTQRPPGSPNRGAY